MATEIPRMPAPDEYDAPRKGNWQGSMGHHQPPEPRAAVAGRPKPAFGWRSAVLGSRMRAPRLSDGSRSSLRLLMPGTAANVAAGRRCDAGSWRTGPPALPPRPAGTPAIGRGAQSGADLDQFFAERRQRPLFDLFRQSQRAQEVRDVVGERVKLEAHCVVPEGPAGQARPAERVLAFFDPLFRRATAVVEP